MLAPFSPQSHARKAKLKRKGTFHKQASVGDYLIDSSIGEGTDGIVYLGKHGNTNVAIKHIRTLGNKAHEGRVLDEANAMALCHDHPNICTLFDVVKSKQDMFLVMQLAEGGDLFEDVVHQGPMGCADARRLLHQLVSAVQHMHVRGVAHRDIKPENVLLDAGRSTVLLTDFGKAKVCRGGHRMCSDPAGTVRCLPPEVFHASGPNGARQYDPMAVDVWGLGVVFFFLLTSRFPFDGKDSTEIAHNIVNGKVSHHAPPSMASSAKDLLIKLLNPNPDTRPSIDEVAAHVYFADPRQASS